MTIYHDFLPLSLLENSRGTLSMSREGESLQISTEIAAYLGNNTIWAHGPMYIVRQNKVAP